MQAAATNRNVNLVPPDKATGILAKSLFRELKGNGYSRDQILAISGELISLVTSDIDRGSRRA
jgi:hypothetical protein